jgi:hypothetical protein
MDPCRRGSIPTVRTRVLLLALVVLVAGCGSGGGSKANAGATSTSTTTAPAGAGFEQYRDCLSQHGVDLPEGRRPGGMATGTSDGGPRPDAGQGQRPPRSLPEDVDQATFEAAQQACQSLRPQGGFGGGPGGGAAFDAYASCLGDHGVTTTTVADGQQPQGPGFDRNDPNFAEANTTCAALLPSATTTTEAAK